MAKYAILLSGGINNRNNHARYKNDLEWVYKVLVEDCGYIDSNITVFYANGCCLNYKEHKIGAFPANDLSVMKVLEKFAGELNPSDELVFVVTNHGGSSCGGRISMWGAGYIRLDTLARQLNRIAARKIVILGECFAGNILDYEISNACVLTANQKGMESYTNPYELRYDEFIYHFFAYIHGAYPDGKPLDEESENEINKAYRYAVNNDFFHPDNPKGQRIRQITKTNIIQIPQMKNNLNGVLQL